MDILNSLAKKLRLLELESPETNAEGVQIVWQDQLINGTKNGLSLSLLPTAGGNVSFSIERELSLPIQFTIANYEQAKAFSDIWKIEEAFGMLPNNSDKFLPLSENGSYNFIKSETATSPQQIEISEQDIYIYVLTVNFTIDK